MNIFEVLSNGERIIVYAREDHSQIYTWNQSLTLQCWDVTDDGDFIEVEVRTLSTQPRNYDVARFLATEWCNEGTRTRWSLD